MSKTSLREGAALYAAVALGSLIGALARAGLGPAVDHLAGAQFPYGTLFVNVTGSFAIGFYAALGQGARRLSAHPLERHFVMTGICGGYTTFSMFSLESLRLIVSGRIGAAALNIAGSALCWLAAVWLGYALARRLDAKG